MKAKKRTKTTASSVRVTWCGSGRSGTVEIINQTVEPDLTTDDERKEWERCEKLAARRAAQNKRQREARRARREAMESLGLVRVRGNLGGEYWE